jgi:hypothetical protein
MDSERDGIKATKSDTSPLSSSASSSTSGRPEAGLVASYFMDWSSPRVETEATKVEEKESAEVEEEPEDVPVPVVETVEAEHKEFKVTYQCLPDIDVEEEEGLRAGGLRAGRPMQFLDVLLQTDARGIGLNVGLEKLDGEGEEAQVLVVQSFRRLQEGDVGPAEGCGKVRVGDLLHAVDGQEVHSLQQLHAKLQGRLGKKRKFVLLRLLRPVSGDVEGSETTFLRQRKPRVKDAVRWSEVEAVLLDNPEVALFVRQLATTNQVLQDQLVASQLKLEEQTIQLDQLHALYARTQAEGLPLFSLSKSIRPFARRQTSSGAAGSAKPIPTKIQTEVMEAISAEYARLQQEFQMQHALDKRALERKYAEQAAKLEEAAAKKVAMLETGFQQALEHYRSGSHCSCHCLKAASACDEELDTGASVQQCNGASGSTQSAAQATTRLGERDVASRARLEKIQALLVEYENFKNVRLEALGSIRVNCIPSE